MGILGASLLFLVIIIVVVLSVICIFEARYLDSINENEEDND